jgi:hypothetical protein
MKGAMTIMTKLQKIAWLSVGALVAGVMTGGATPASATPTPVQATGVAVSAQQKAGLMAPACIVRDGKPDGGRSRGGAPPRYEFDTSPYLGVRYESCGSSFKIYYGGYTGITHYNIRHYFPGYYGSSDHWRQFEVGATAAGVYTMPADAILKENISKFTVEACKRGGFLQPSSCTSWSPTVTVDPR